MKGLCIFLKHVAAAVIAAILKEKLTLKSSDEIDSAVRNPDTRSTPVRMNSEMRIDRGDAREFKSVGTLARMTIVTRRPVRSQVSSASCFLRHVHCDAA